MIFIVAISRPVIPLLAHTTLVRNTVKSKSQLTDYVCYSAVLFAFGLCGT